MMMQIASLSALALFIAMTHKEFYKTKQWQQCRNAYLKSVGGLCEECEKRGIMRAADIVHHRVHLDDINVNNPAISMNFKNLKAVCRDCHGIEHRRDPAEGRYKIDRLGNIVRARE